MGIEKKTGVPIKGSPERDALTDWRRFLCFKPGERKAAKKSFSRRVRRTPIRQTEDD
jgi:hypothetical protein